MTDDIKTLLTVAKAIRRLREIEIERIGFRKLLREWRRLPRLISNLEGEIERGVRSDIKQLIRHAKALARLPPDKQKEYLEKSFTIKPIKLRGVDL